MSRLLAGAGAFRVRVRAVRCTMQVALVAAVMASPLLAQGGGVSSGAQRASRAELMQLVTEIEASVANGQLKKDRIADERLRLGAIRQRLEKGDFHAGDRFVFTLRQDSVRVDTASVREGQLVSLLALPDFSVAGVLRSELDDKLNAHVARYLRNATVRANVLTRIAVLGAVQSPGFYYAAPDRPLSDLLMLAGGPAAEAKLGELEIFRGTVTILKGKESRRVIESGMTLEQLDVQSGDEVRVPLIKKRRISFQVFVQLLVVFSTLTFAMLNFLQWYYSRQEA